MAKSKDVITQIKKATRRKFSADEKIRIVLEGRKRPAKYTCSDVKEGLTVFLPASPLSFSGISLTFVSSGYLYVGYY